MQKVRERLGPDFSGPHPQRAVFVFTEPSCSLPRRLLWESPAKGPLSAAFLVYTQSYHGRTTRRHIRIQLTTDGNRLYVQAVDAAFGRKIDYAVLRKVYGFDQTETRYSPAKIVTTETEVIKGNPDARHISTSYIERQNLTMRMSVRRFTRLTNGFSKKIENHAYAVALHFVHYNFARIHQTLRVTPAMAAGISDHVWSVEEIVGLLEATESKKAA